MPKFKEYNQNQPMLLPPDIKNLIPSDHICFTIDNLVNDLDISAINKTYSDLGAPAYDPKMMIKLLFYSYTQGIRSSRKIERLANENIVYRYLSANQETDHGTICLFRKNHLAELENIFAQIVFVCAKLKMADLTEISIDGSIFIANASKKNTVDKETIKKIRKRIKKILRQAGKIDKKENKKYGKGKGVYPELPEKLKNKETREKEIQKLTDRLKQLDAADKSINEKQAKVSGKISQEKKLNRNTHHNTTDGDANLMKLKNGKSYKPAYNGQIATSNQIILAYEISDNGGDAGMLEPMIDKTEETIKTKVKTVKADAGYFSKKNIDYIKQKEIDAYIPDQKKAKEEKQEATNSIPKFDKQNFKYDSEQDEFICPGNKRLKYLEQIETGKEAGVRRYTGKKVCGECKFKSKCTKGKYRKISYNPKFEEYKIEMRKKLNTTNGKLKYQERMYDVEPVFGNISYNQKANHFLCRGKPMVKIEFGLSCISHNLVKITNWLKKQNIDLNGLQLDTSTRLGANS